MTVSEIDNETAERACRAFFQNWDRSLSSTRFKERNRMKAALTAALSDQAGTIRACARSTLIGFQTELGDRNIEFICDQIARKATLGSDEAGGWMPISTAPKDGGRVIGARDGIVAEMFYSQKQQGGTGTHVHPGGWVSSNGHLFYPTHWHPLLAPPPSSTAGEG